MKAKFLHVGMPITNKKEGMEYVDAFKVWVSNPDDYDFAIEYLKYEEGTPFPEVLHRNPHVCYEVADMQPYLEEAEQVLFGPVPLSDTMDFAYVMWDGTILELQAPKKD